MSEQGSQEWKQDRAGCATASRFVDIIAVSKKTGEPLKAREDYLWMVATERLYQTPTESISSRPTDWGKELEAYAKRAYEVQTGAFIEERGFVLHKDIPFCGCSPDGLIGLDGGIEIKCPKDRRVHMKTWREGMSDDHLPQVQGNLWVMEREWYDFLSYDPRAPEEFRLYVQRIHRNEKYILALKDHVERFLGDVNQLIKEFHGRLQQQ